MIHLRLFSGFRKRAALFTAILVFVALPLSSGIGASGDRAPLVIRDTEIEDVLKEWTKTVIKASDLDPAAVKFILVQDSDINAFVSGGPNIFIYTGLLDKTKTPDEVIGVIAHELGHIRGGHLVRMRTQSENLSYESLLGAALGIGAAIVTGNGGVGAAVSSGAQSSALNKLLAFSRVQESSADQSALSSLEQAGMSARGLLAFMQTLESQEILPASQQSEYIRTHPLTRDRVEAIRAGYERSSARDAQLSPEWQTQHDLIIAKLRAFISPERVAWDYKDTDHSLPAEYARAVADYRQNNVSRALEKVEGLLKRQPENPYFMELKGQMLVDFGRVEEALPFYRKAIEHDPDAALIRIAYASALIERSDGHPERLEEGVQNLDRAARDEPHSPRVFHLLATAYGRKGQEPMAKLYLAEEALLNKQVDYAKKQAEAARSGLQKGSRAWLRAQDILSYVEQNDKKD